MPRRNLRTLLRGLAMAAGSPASSADTFRALTRRRAEKIIGGRVYTMRLCPPALKCSYAAFSMPYCVSHCSACRKCTSLATRLCSSLKSSSSSSSGPDTSGAMKEKSISTLSMSLTDLPPFIRARTTVSAICLDVDSSSRPRTRGYDCSDSTSRTSYASRGAESTLTTLREALASDTTPWGARESAQLDRTRSAYCRLSPYTATANAWSSMCVAAMSAGSCCSFALNLVTVWQSFSNRSTAVTSSRPPCTSLAYFASLRMSPASTSPALTLGCSCRHASRRASTVARCSSSGNTWMTASIR
mmetsp:Transcript_1576/g.5415  ORF Transcript_1576/g.5415 Transcript_1576/m.5415 type:complete len:301 (+) Transcript_1576:910-1812(+)